LNHADEDGRTALHVAAFCVRPSETHHEVVSCLLECGANPNMFDCEGITPLLGAARAGNRTVCELCLEADTDVNQADKILLHDLFPLNNTNVTGLTTGPSNTGFMFYFM
uniref:ANK_REP_REGION domain-containing protein n=1 Tax=Echinostoma caproni TaxID=27848 RepID=A0A183BG72_9TREM